MNINTLIYRIKKHVGLNGVLKNIYSDYKIRDSIFASLIEFNRHSGFTIAYTLRELLFNTERIKNDTLYDVAHSKDIVIRIPEELTSDIEKAGCKIKSVRMYNMQTLYLNYQDRIKRGIKDLAWDFSRQEANTWNEIASKPLFRAPNTVVLQGCSFMQDLLYDQELQIICEHPKNLATITTNLEGYFEDLCKLDLMMDIYNNNLAYLKLDIGNGAIDPPLQDFQNASSEKKQLIETIRAKGSIDNVQLL